MSAPEDPRIWQGIRAHLDELGSVANAPPIGILLDRRRSRRPLRAVAGLAGAGAIVLAIGLLLPALRAVTAPIVGATPTSASGPATPAASPTASPLDWAKLIGHAYVVIAATEDGHPLTLVPEARPSLGLDASRFGASTGCNGMGGTYQILDGRLVTADGYMTLRGCTGALGRQEGWYIAFLQSSPTITRVDATGLVLTSGGTVVTYVDDPLGSLTPARELTWVAVTGPAGFLPPEDLILEMADMAWYGYGGVVSVPTSGSTEVRLVGRETCRTYAEFVSKSGSKTVIRFSKDGQVEIEDWTGRNIDAGPALAHRQMSDCPVT